MSAPSPFFNALKLAFKAIALLIGLSLLWYGFQRISAKDRQIVVERLEIEPAPVDSTKRLPDAAGHTDALKIGAYNIAHARGGKLGESNWNSETRVRLEAHLLEIADQIRAQDLHVIILNEVDFDANWSGNQDQATFIARHAGFPYVAKLTNIDIAFPFFTLQFGNAILSKLPLTEVQAIALPPVSDWEPILAGKKNALEVTIQLGGRDVRIVAIHNETRNEETRLGSVDALLRRIRSSNTPYILAGDFNSQRTSSGGTPTDLDTLLVQGSFSTDQQPDEWRTFPSEKPNRGIDWIISNRSLGVSNSRIISSDLSDHLMITATVR